MANYNIQKESTLHLVLDRKAVEPNIQKEPTLHLVLDRRAVRAVANYNIQKESTLHLVLDRKAVELWRITISRRSRLSILY